MGFQISLVQDIWDFKTNDFKPVVGLITNGLFRRHYNQIKDNFPRQWARILKNEDPYNGEFDTIFLLQNGNILIDVQNATAKELYTAILTNKYGSSYYVRPNGKMCLETKLFGKLFTRG